MERGFSQCLRRVVAGVVLTIFFALTPSPNSAQAEPIDLSRALATPELSFPRALDAELWSAPLESELPAHVPLEAAYDAHMLRYVRAGTFSGTVLIARHGQVVFEKAYGVADRAAGEANGLDTHFLLASVTKQFVAALAMQQIERGNLSLDDRAIRFVPDANPAWANITIAQLLNHSNGIVDYLNTESIMGPIRNKENTPKSIVDRFKKLKLVHAPGARYDYTNSGYLLLGYILEQVTGLSYAELLRRDIFHPLGMSESGVETPTEMPDPYATGYTKNRRGQWIKYRYTHPSAAFACGDIYSTVGDLLRWDQGLRSNRILSERSREQMFTASAGTYGYGFRLAPIRGRRTAWHTGHLRGMANMITRFLDDDAVIVVLNNYGSSPVKDITSGLASILLERRMQYIEMRLGEGTDAY